MQVAILSKHCKFPLQFYRSVKPLQKSSTGFKKKKVQFHIFELYIKTKQLLVNDVIVFH